MSGIIVVNYYTFKITYHCLDKILNILATYNMIEYSWVFYQVHVLLKIQVQIRLQNFLLNQTMLFRSTYPEPEIMLSDCCQWSLTKFGKPCWKLFWVSFSFLGACIKMPWRRKYGVSIIEVSLHLLTNMSSSCLGSCGFDESISV